MVVTLVALETDRGKSLMAPWRCKTMLFAWDVCTGKDFPGGQVEPSGAPLESKIVNISLDVVTFLGPSPTLQKHFFKENRWF